MSLDIAVPGTIGTPSAWTESELSWVGSVVLAGAGAGDLVALYGSDSDASPPAPGDLICLLRGAALQAPTIPAHTYYAVTALTLAGGAVTCTLADGLVAPSYVTLVAGAQRTGETTPQEIARLSFDPSEYPATDRTITLVAELEVAVPGQTVTLELYNLTDGATVDSLTSMSTTGQETSVELAVPGRLPNSSKRYSLRLSRSGGTSADLACCKSAFLKVSF